jgi:hypothetical protein
MGVDAPTAHPGGDKKPIVACSFRFSTRTQTSSEPGSVPGHGCVQAGPRWPCGRGRGCRGRQPLAFPPGGPGAWLSKAGAGVRSGPWIKAGICYSFSSNATHPRRGPLGRFWILESESESAGPVVVGGIYGRYTPIPNPHPLAIAPRQDCDAWVIKILLWMK